jgi:hypothetical protein
MVTVMVMVSESVWVTTGWTEAARVVIAETAEASAVRGVGSPERPLASSWNTADSVTVPAEVAFQAALCVRFGICFFLSHGATMLSRYFLLQTTITNRDYR